MFTDELTPVAEFSSVSSSPSQSFRPPSMSTSLSLPLLRFPPPAPIPPASPPKSPEIFCQAIELVLGGSGAEDEVERDEQHGEEQGPEQLDELPR
eukprot:CAMPEP_0171618740 /NCGR_PEP_ID=MMETSP0990-20121206/14938_1 /TAXON_ID=483369 /ORGANISM="non described non described, Strain CCMP2098" /LENGTH=94 /DNA_ID=CAMNT_0012183625 /DNA_START=318 /DNA_END=598 /DNA_ORIENTATION=+